MGGLSRKSMRVLTIDVGTNSTLYLIAQLKLGKLTVLERGIYANHLGEALMRSGSLTSEVIEVNRSILQEIAQKGRNWGVRAVQGVGTAALRAAHNRELFLGEVRALGIPFRVITAEEEARLSWVGVFGPQGPGEMRGILDLGGGSTELAWGKGEEPSWHGSVSCGSVVLASRWFRNDPPIHEEIAGAESELQATFRDWTMAIQVREESPSPSPPFLVGTAGTVTALALIELQIPHYVPDCITGVVLTYETVTWWARRLLTMGYQERLHLPGMPPVRARYIHAGALILKVIMEVLGLSRLEVSDRGLLFGVAYQLGEKFF